MTIALSSSADTIASYLSLGLTVAFFAIIAILILSFLWGVIAQGWKYGTYHLLFLILLAVIAFVTLAPIANMILKQLDLSQFLGSTQSFTITGASDQDVTITVTISTVQETLNDLFTQLFKAYDVDLDPAALETYVMALTRSTVYTVLIVVDAILIGLLGNIFIWLLWKILFVFIFCPGGKEKRKKKTARWLSGLENAVGCLLILAMAVLPLTSVLNSLSASLADDDTSEKSEQGETTNEVYATVQKVVDTYDDSLFSKVFFSWTKDENGDTFDVSLVNYFTNVAIDDDNIISMVSELRSLVSAASYAIEGGLLTSDGVTQASAVTFATSSYAPKMLSALAGSQLVSTVMPYGLAVAMNIDEIADYVKTETDLDYGSYDYGATLNELADLYQTVIDSGLLEEAFDADGNLAVTDNKDTLADIVLDKWADLREIVVALDGEELALFNDILKAAIWVQIVHEYEAESESSNEDAISFGVKDFFPAFEASELRNDEGEIKDAPEAIRDLVFTDDVLPALDRVVDIMKVDDELLPTALAISDHLDNITDEDISSLLKIVLRDDNLDQIEHYIDGYEVPTDDSIQKAAEESFTPLLGIPMLQYAVPKIIDLGFDWVNGFLGDAGYDGELDATDAKARYESIQDKPAAIMQESQAIFGVLRPFAKSDAGQALITDYFDKKQLTGVYFSPEDGSFLAADKALLTPLAEGIKSLDKSKLVSYVLPKVMEDVINENADSINSALGLEGDDQLTFDFTSDKTDIGSGLADLLLAYADCQDLILAVRSSVSSLNGVYDAEVLVDSLLSYTVEGSNGEKQLSRLLSAFVNNPLLDNSSHSNVISLLAGFIKKAGLGDFRTEIEEIFAEDDFDLDANIEGLINLLDKANDANLWKALSCVSDGALDLAALSYLKEISFEDLFSDLNDLPLVTGILSSVLDAKLADYLSYGDGKSLSFSSIEDWSSEGKAIDALVSFAADIGDLSYVSLLRGDPDSIESTIKALAGSSIFYDEDGNYVLPEFLADTLIDDTLVGSSYGKYFTNYTLAYDENGNVTSVDSGDPALSSSYSDFRDAILSLSTPESVSEEAGKIANVLRAASSIDISTIVTSGVSEVDFSEIGTAPIRDLLESLASSTLFGHVTLTHAYETIASSLGESLSAFGYANYYYMYDETVSEADRLEEVDLIATIAGTALNPVFGILTAEGKMPDTVTISITDFSANYFLKPILTAMQDSEVWNSPSPVYQNSSDYQYTAFKELLVYAFKDSSFFAEDSTHTVEEVTRKAVYMTEDWDAEVDAIVTVINDFSDMGLDLTGGLSIDSLFDDGVEEGKAQISQLLGDISSSAILSKGLPEKLNQAISSVSLSGVDLSLANVYYVGAVSGWPTLAKDPYSEDEINALATIFAEAHELGNDLEITSLDDEKIDALMDLLCGMAKSYIFNSVASGQTSTIFESTISDLYETEGLKEYVYLDYSPKDIHYVSEGAYTDASSKASYLTETKIGILEYPDKTPADLTNLDSLNGEQNSLGSVLKTILKEGLVDALKSGGITSLGEDSLKASLNALDSCFWTMDMVPNAIADAIKDGGFDIDGVDLLRANPFFAYYQTGGTYESPVGKNEIDIIAGLMTSLQDPSVSSLSDPSSLTEDSLSSLRSLLGRLCDSEIFHLAGASYDLEEDKNSSLDDETDLDVFRQVVYKFYSDSSLDVYAYDAVYDGTYATAEDKLLASVKAVDDDDWQAELDALLVNDAGTSGFVYDAFGLGLFGSSGSGVSFDSSNMDFSSFEPSEIEVLMRDMNGFSLGHDAMTYMIKDLFDGDIGLTEHTWLSHTFMGDAEALNSSLGRLPYVIKSISSTESITLSYEISGNAVSLSGTSFPFYADTAYSMPLGSDITIESDSTDLTDPIELTVTWSVADFFLSKEDYDDCVIFQITDVLSGIYDDSTGKYPSLGSDESFGAVLEDPSTFLSLIRFFKYDGGLFDTPYSTSCLPVSEGEAKFYGSDVILANILSLTLNVEISGVSVPASLKLLTYFPDYDAYTPWRAYADINLYFAEGDDDYASSTEWLRNNFTAASYFDMINSSTPDGVSAGSYYYTRMELMNNLLSESSSQIGVSLSDYLTYDGTSLENLEGIFKFGLANLLYKDIRTYALGEQYCYTFVTASNEPSSISDLSKRSANNLTGWLYLNIHSDDALSFLSSSKKLIEVANLLAITVSNASNGWKVSSEDKALIESDLTSFKDWTLESPLSDLFVTYYQGLIYELMVNRTYYHGEMKVGNITLPEVDLIDAPYGDDGYAAKASSYILTA